MQSFDDELRVLKEVFRDLEVEEGEQGCVLVIPVGDDPVRRPRLSVTVPQCYATGGKRAEVVTDVPRPPGKKRGKKKKPGDKAKFRAFTTATGPGPQRTRVKVQPAAAPGARRADRQQVRSPREEKTKKAPTLFAVQPVPRLPDPCVHEQLSPSYLCL
ncbi:hypothetical protein DIPPA_23409 [Diplonema papillatum]|nr:hypothetical protein DIPPA_23409 [Diplonema papillatum]